ncbi:DNA (cytosine-5-)-methyltransferase [Fusobacterium mortiferum]|uniref:DNA cytosine methyltransferase n=1 Tax=Fusobacterium mortiferum TaxID=850 RepID=UPI00195E8532
MMIRLGTVFSGVGAIEHAFKRLNLKHKIIFACDNGGVDIFGKKIGDNFLEIDEEIIYLDKIIKNLNIPNFEEYIDKLKNDLKSLIVEVSNLKINFLSRDIDIQEIKEQLKLVFEEIDFTDIKEFKKFIPLENQDISNVLILVNELEKYITKNFIDNHFLKEKAEYLKKVTENKEYRKMRREIKEIPKKLSELHSTIKTLEVLSELSKINEYEEKKRYIDSLYSSKENSNFVKKSYVANYEIQDKDFHWNVSFLDGNQYKGQVDLFVGGSPCQSFSMVGKRKGFEDTRGTLFYEFVRILKEVEPKFFIYENVQGVLSHDGGQTWEIMQNSFREAGYYFKYYVLNAKNFGIPQNRNRIFVVGAKNEEDFKKFGSPQEIELELTLSNFLEDTIENKYFLPEKGIKFVTDPKNLDKQYTQINGKIALCQKANQQFNWHGDFIEYYSENELERISKIDQKYFLSDKVKNYVLSEEDSLIKPEVDLKIARPLTATMHKMHRAGVDNYISYGKNLPLEKRKIRKLTPRECFRLMGFSDDFKIVVSDTQAYQQAGNSIVVDILINLLENVFKFY